MIDPNIWQSEDFAKLSLLSKLVFIGMFSNADDEGRGRAKPVYLKSTIFPYEDDLRVADIEKSLQEIAAMMSVTLYAHNENKYYQFNNWSKWQRVDKPQSSKIPAPESFQNHSGLTPDERKGKGKEDKLKEEEANARARKGCSAELDDEKISELRNIGEAYEADIGVIASSAMLEIREFYLDKGISAPVIIKAIQAAAENNARNWPYIRAILNRCENEKVFKLDDWDKAESRKKSRKKQEFKPVESAGSYEIDDLESMIDRGIA